VKFFFPDSQDMVDPSFDFENETHSEFRVRQHDDLYAHEVFKQPPFDGLLVSMGMVESIGGAGAGRYTMAQRHRLRRVGAREFFRLPPRSDATARLETMGDCGAFSYVREPEPPFTTEEVVDFYTDCGFDYGISVDHAIMGFKPDYDTALPEMDLVPPDWTRRQQITMGRAREFLKVCAERKVRFEPVGVAHGWSPVSYASTFDKLQKEGGFQLIALGGLVPLKTREIFSVLDAIAEIRKPGTGIHLLGIGRVEHVSEFARYGVTSFDSTSPLRQAFKDELNNYYTLDRTYSAIRIPQVDGNPKLARRIRAGEVDQAEAQRLERLCLDGMAAFDQGAATVNDVLDPLQEYESLYDGRRTRRERYREVLEARPWTECPCDICRNLQYHVILFRGAERNRRRGFHNVFVSHRRLMRTMKEIR
jgi:queuine/archaeosine tRNA-ribosyltransferase